MGKLKLELKSSVQTHSSLTVPYYLRSKIRTGSNFHPENGHHTQLFYFLHATITNYICELFFGQCTFYTRM